MSLTISSESNTEVIEGEFSSPIGKIYPIRDGIPRLISRDDEFFSDEERRENEYYEATAREYDHIMDWMFESFGENEDDVREKMVGLLSLRPGGSCALASEPGVRPGPDELQ